MLYHAQNVVNHLGEEATALFLPIVINVNCENTLGGEIDKNTLQNELLVILIHNEQIGQILIDQLNINIALASKQHDMMSNS